MAQGMAVTKRIIVLPTMILLSNNFNVFLYHRPFSNQIRNKSWKPECVRSFNMDWRILVFYPEPEARDKNY